MNIIEYAFYIHGVVPDRLPGSHEDQYGELHQGISTCIEGAPWPSLIGQAEWGWQKNQTKRTSHRALADAQKVFGDKVLKMVSDAWDFTLRPDRSIVNGMRKTMMYGFGDMFYYVSTDGKWAVRNAVAAQLKQHIEESLPDDCAISLTLLGHSAGSVIAFDLLYYLFMNNDKFEKSLATPESGSEPDVNAFRSNLEKLREWNAEGKFRLRMLVTFGSPISMLMFRSHEDVETLASGNCLMPEQYGLSSEIKDNPLKWNAPRWLNLWDKDDPISWPISPIMGNHRLVKDECIDVSDSVVTVHNAYWENLKAHQAIAKYWKELEQ